MSEDLRKLFLEQQRAKLRQAAALEEEAKALRQEAATLAKMAKIDVVVDNAVETG